MWDHAIQTTQWNKPLGGRLWCFCQMPSQTCHYEPHVGFVHIHQLARRLFKCKNGHQISWPALGRGYFNIIACLYHQFLYIWHILFTLIRNALGSKLKKHFIMKKYCKMLVVCWHSCQNTWSKWIKHCWSRISNQFIGTIRHNTNHSFETRPA